MTRFSLPAMRALPIIAAALLVLAGCGDQDPTTKGAREALKARGLTPDEIVKTQSERTLAACGTTRGQRFVYRDPDLSLEAETDPAKFAILWASWCKPEPSTP